MKKVAVITDSNSGITQEEAKKLGITVLPMPFFINDELYYEDITLSQEGILPFPGTECGRQNVTADAGGGAEFMGQGPGSV